MVKTKVSLKDLNDNVNAFEHTVRESLGSTATTSAVLEELNKIRGAMERICDNGKSSDEIPPGSDQIICDFKGN